MEEINNDFYNRKINNFYNLINFFSGITNFDCVVIRFRLMFFFLFTSQNHDVFFYYENFIYFEFLFNSMDCGGKYVYCG